MLPKYLILKIKKLSELSSFHMDFKSKKLNILICFSHGRVSHFVQLKQEGKRSFINLSSHRHEHRCIHMMMNKCHPASSGFCGFAFGKHFKD